jgi:hypothetical protein
MSEMSLALSAEPSPARSRQFFDVSVLKLVVMSTVTLTFYQIYWFYRNWRLAKERGEDVWPLPRAIFAVLFAYSLFKDVRHTGRSVSLTAAANASGLAWLYFFFQLTWRLPDPAWLIGLASVLPLALVQRDIARVHRALGFDPGVNDRFSWKNIVGIVVGSLFILLVIVGMFLPEESV